MDRDKLLRELQKLDFPKTEYTVTAGGALLLHGLREQTADVDLSCTPALADTLEAQGYGQGTRDGRRYFRLSPVVEIYESAALRPSVLIDGYPALTLEALLEQKRRLNRPKDQKDIQALESALKNKEDKEK